MARAHRHGGGATTEIFRQFTPARPGATLRTIVIKNFIDKTQATTGRIPTIAETAYVLRMRPSQVEPHYQILGLDETSCATRT